jgi:hypothetical protein
MQLVIFQDLHNSTKETSAINGMNGKQQFYFQIYQILKADTNAFVSPVCEQFIICITNLLPRKYFQL